MLLLYKKKKKKSIGFCFGEKKVFLFLFFKYCADVEKYESFKGFGFIYIYIYRLLLHCPVVVFCGCGLVVMFPPLPGEIIRFI